MYLSPNYAAGGTCNLAGYRFNSHAVCNSSSASTLPRCPPMLCPWRNATSYLYEDAYTSRGISVNWPLALPIVERVVYNGRAVMQKPGPTTAFTMTLVWDKTDGLSYSGRQSSTSFPLGR